MPTIGLYETKDGTRFDEFENGDKFIRRTDGSNVRFNQSELCVIVLKDEIIYSICDLILPAYTALLLAKRWELKVVIL